MATPPRSCIALSSGLAGDIQPRLDPQRENAPTRGELDAVTISTVLRVSQQARMTNTRGCRRGFERDDVQAVALLRFEDRRRRAIVHKIRGREIGFRRAHAATTRAEHVHAR